jgi:hypothetical protein
MEALPNPTLAPTEGDLWNHESLPIHRATVCGSG